MLEFPTEHTERCTETVQFLETGGQRWTRTVQLRIPDYEQPVGENLVAVSLGMFQRVRLADIVIRDASGKRLNFLTRPQHGAILTQAVLWKYMRPYASRLRQLSTGAIQDADKAKAALDAYDKLVHEIYALLTSVAVNDIATRDVAASGCGTAFVEFARSLASADGDNLTTTQGSEEVDADDYVSELLRGLTTDIVDLQGVTQYLCWVSADPGEVVSIEATYTATDPLNAVENHALASASTHQTGLLREFGLAPLNYAFPVPSTDHAGSYYFRLEAPENTELEYLDWESGNSIEDHDDELECAYPAVHFHNLAVGDKSRAQGSRILAYVRCSSREHKRVAAGAMLNFVFSLLIANGRLATGLTSTAQLWLLLTPTALLAYLAEQQKHYYARSTRRQRAVLWGYLIICAAFLVSVSFSLASAAPDHSIQLGIVAQALSVITGIASLMVCFWYASLGYWYDKTLIQRARKIFTSGVASRSTAFERASVEYGRRIVIRVIFAIPIASLSLFVAYSTTRSPVVSPAAPVATPMSAVPIATPFPNVPPTPSARK